MIKVSIYARSGNVGPAGYYRIYQYLYEMNGITYKIRPLLTDKQFLWFMKHKAKNGILSLLLYMIQYTIIIFRVTFFLISDFFYEPKYIILSRVFVPRIVPFPILVVLKIVLKKSKLIWDFDDHILDSKQISKAMFDYFSRKSEKIIVIHDFLKELIDKRYHDKVLLLPTTDGDMRFYTEESLDIIRHKSYATELRLLWLATSSNIPSLMKVLSALDEAARILNNDFGKELTLTVVCNLPVVYNSSYLNVRNITWSHDIAIHEMINAHVGIMPLIKNEFAKGKGGFKLVQYMSIGLPVIGSNVGFNGQIIDDSIGKLIDDNDGTEKWVAAVLNLAGDWERYEILSHNARQKWDDSFSYQHNLNVWEEMLK